MQSQAPIGERKRKCEVNGSEKRKHGTQFMQHVSPQRPGARSYARYRTMHTIHIPCCTSVRAKYSGLSTFLGRDVTTTASRVCDRSISGIESPAIHSSPLPRRAAVSLITPDTGPVTEHSCLASPTASDTQLTAAAPRRSIAYNSRYRAGHRTLFPRFSYSQRYTAHRCRAAPQYR
ncbi:hypothetical protein J6590_003676 [Homalodisca vitripennis]|nr:hypothetical protein J6590_003676 [Homalodisca vitripennis]